MKLSFGEGDILVTSANVKDSVSYLILEPGKGPHIVGEFTTDPERGPSVEVNMEAISKDSIVLEFSSPESVAVVLEKIQSCLMHQLGLPV